MRRVPLTDEQVADLNAALRSDAGWSLEIDGRTAVVHVHLPDGSVALSADILLPDSPP